jgi:hypothetical protein
MPVAAYVPALAQDEEPASELALALGVAQA